MSLRVIDEAGFAEVLRQHHGQVVLVDFWATWCIPCLEALPHTVDLHRRFAARGLAVISVSLDEPDNQPAVRAVLAEKGAAFENLLSAYGVGSKTFEVFHVEAIPHFDLYDQQGKLRQSFGGDGKPIDLPGIDRAVEELLAPHPPP